MKKSKAKFILAHNSKLTETIQMKYRKCYHITEFSEYLVLHYNTDHKMSWGLEQNLWQ